MTINTEDMLNSILSSFSRIDYVKPDDIPNIDLYMDQVITFISKQLEAFTNESDKIITPSMINNYTKDGIIPRPVNKKYNKTHLTSILMMCVFKQILPINDITIFIDKAQEENISKQYDIFAEMQNDQVRKIAERLDQVLKQTGDDAVLLCEKDTAYDQVRRRKNKKINRTSVEPFLIKCSCGIIRTDNKEQYEQRFTDRNPRFRCRRTDRRCTNE